MKIEYNKNNPLRGFFAFAGYNLEEIGQITMKSSALDKNEAYWEAAATTDKKTNH
jgi:hypothetical protein